MYKIGDEFIYRKKNIKIIDIITKEMYSMIKFDTTEDRVYKYKYIKSGRVSYFAENCEAQKSFIKINNDYLIY